MAPRFCNEGVPVAVAGRARAVLKEHPIGPILLTTMIGGRTRSDPPLRREPQR